jgi:hypothetical protein
MIRRPTWIILIIFVLVIGAALLVEKTPYFQPAPTATATTAPHLLISSVSAVKMVDAAGLTESLKQDASKVWTADVPSDVQVNQGNMAELESTLLGIEIISSPQTAPPADATGLAKPAETITITDATSQVHVLKIGLKTPTSSGYYVQMDQGKPVIVSTTTIDRIVVLISGVRATPTPPPAPTNNPATTPTPEGPTPTATP